MKKSLLLFMLFLSVSVRAADKVPGVIVELSSGGTIEFALANNPKMVFDGKKIKISSTKDNAEYEPSEITKVRIGEIDNFVNGIIGIQEGKGKIITDGGFVRLTGFPVNEKISVFSINGVLVESFRTDSDGSFSINLSNLPSGISFIKTNNESIKISRQ